MIEYRHFHHAAKFASIGIVWVSWVAAYLADSWLTKVLLVIGGFLPYWFFYNWFVCGVLDARFGFDRASVHLKTNEEDRAKRKL